MSLMTYKEAVPWGESIRDELTSRPDAAVADRPAKPRRQRDASDQRTRRRRDRHVGVRGNAARLVRRHRQAAPDSRRCRTSGSSDQPDLVVAMESEHTLGANDVEETKDFSIPSGITEVKWVRAADLLPETPDDRARRDHQRRERADARALAAGQRSAQPRRAAPRSVSRQARRCTCRSTTRSLTRQEQDALSDKSRIGLYFTDPPASGRELQSIVDEREDGQRRIERRPDSHGDAAERRTRLRAASDARQGIRQRRHRGHHAERQADFAVEAARPAPAVVPPVLAAGGDRSSPRRERDRGALHASSTTTR